VSSNPRHYSSDQRDYLQCARCDLVFVPQEQLPDPAFELAHYRMHNNSPNDPGYRRFLSRTLKAVVEHLPAPARGLDFGCGPGPALPTMFRELGYEMRQYDPLFCDDASVLDEEFNFVCATEVVEHVHWPHEVYKRLFSRLKPGGCLAVMTKRLSSQAAFARWHYKNDPTHVRFYSDRTMRFVAQMFKREVRLVGPDVVLFV
jgi:SAM-dependent methyltransferase